MPMFLDKAVVGRRYVVGWISAYIKGRRIASLSVPVCSSYEVCKCCCCVYVATVEIIMWNEGAGVHTRT